MRSIRGKTTSLSASGRRLAVVHNTSQPTSTFEARRVLPAVAAQNDFTLVGDELKARRDAGRACSRSLE